MLSLRLFSVLTVAACSLAACGSPGGTPAATVTPEFVVPSPVAAADAASPESAPAATVSAAPTTSSAPATSTAPVRVKYVFPVKASNVAFHPTHSKYPATDIFADCGEPAVATTSGVVLEVSRTDAYVKGKPDGPLNGGLSVSIVGDDGVRYYGSHLSRIAPGIKAGVRVEAGQRVGDVGHTGNANGVCHLHYGISPPCARTGDWKVRRGVIWPADYLKSWRKNGGKSPVSEVAAWKKAHDCKA
ncbi:M23 family metallopeptidase [Amorphoplanes digitatis]|uniref:Murein DD-endopeptidase MepM/ murein hydrolase activator NlpD n=1 Tax=Actinoplanes digitatis TaxID=1868 RepID=A0A7W7I6S2_9ACTN|nr:M23 family metallopeptidase [Actinoplanes digitatis]MBB4767477.1 murein DD-endopeptidase MepM/ murein hydrolase activator NlpD [Actinoplanes digitatis]